MAALRSNDYADWLPPMLVKELRQGLRANAFVAVFGLVQIAMIALMAMRLFGTAVLESEDRKLIDQSVWGALITALIVAMPMRGLGAIQEEVKAGTLELVRLSRINTARLVLNKWIALNSQTLLLVIAVLPYFVLRYFFGDLEIALELAALGWFVLGSLALTALFIALSTTSKWAQGIAVGLTALPCTIIIAVFISSGAEAFTSGGASFLAYLLPLVLAIPFLLVVACMRIAHSREHFSPWLRGLALVATGIGVTGYLLGNSSSHEAWLGVSSPLLFWAAVESLMEPMDQALPATAGNTPPRFLARWLHPSHCRGWPAGVRFVALITLAIAGTLGWDDGGDSGWMVFLAWLQFGVAVIFPRALLDFIPRFRYSHMAYMIVQGLCVLWVIGTQIVFNDGSSVEVGCVISQAILPHSSFIWLLDNENTSVITHPEVGLHALFAVPVDLLIVGLLVRHYRSSMKARLTMNQLPSSTVESHRSLSASL